MLRFLVAAAIAASGFSSTALAGKTYTPQQLHKMIAAGRYPKQGPVEKTVRQMDYAACIVTLETIVGAVKPEYPALTVVSTNLMRTEKVWTNDGAVTVTCSGASNELILTKADYQ